VPFDPSTLVLTGKRIVGSVMYRPILMSTILDFLVRNRHKLPFHTLIADFRGAKSLHIPRGELQRFARILRLFVS
jgi:hypothetical protein